MAEVEVDRVLSIAAEIDQGRGLPMLVAYPDLVTVSGSSLVNAGISGPDLRGARGFLGSDSSAGEALRDHLRHRRRPLPSRGNAEGESRGGGGLSCARHQGRHGLWHRL